MEREKLGSRLGFILLSAGCAIGIGNVWKFPYITGQNGGGIFVAFYLFFLVILGIPLMSMEFATGRAAQKSPVKLFNQLEKKGQKWHLHGYICMAGNYLLMMFYTTVAGWMLFYLYASATGKYQNMNSNGVSEYFYSVRNSPGLAVLTMSIIVIVGFFIISRGLQNGLEKITKVMMLFLIVLMIALAVHSVFMKDGKEGLSFYLKPDLNKMKEVGIGNVILSAMTQAFFTLSLGIGSMAIFGSYINKDRSLLGESVNVAMLDTFVAICSGLIIFPACAAYDVNVDSGPPLLFITLPNVFNNLPGGRIWGTLFFLFMVFAAFSTVLAVFENISSCCMDLFGWTRKKSSIINTFLVIILSLPCATGYSILSGFNPLGKDTTVLDLEDFIVSNILLPVGSIIFLMFCVSKKGWGWKNYTDEANSGKGIKIKSWMKGYLTYILPLIILAVFILGLVKD